MKRLIALTTSDSSQAGQIHETPLRPYKFLISLTLLNDLLAVSVLTGNASSISKLTYAFGNCSERLYGANKLKRYNGLTGHIQNLPYVQRVNVGFL